MVKFIRSLLIFLLFSSNIVAQCDLTPTDGISGPVEILVTNFEITGIISTGADCRLEYSLSYQFLSTSCTIFFMQGLVKTSGGSETSFVVDRSGSIITVNGTIWNAPCSGTVGVYFNGGWGGSCSNTNVNYPGTECITVPYGTVPVVLELSLIHI